MTTPTSPVMHRVYFFLVLTTFFWGGSFLFTKIGVATIPPQLFVLTRFILAAAIMLLVCSRHLGKLDSGILVRGMTVGIALGLTNLSFVFGIHGTSISRAGILNNLFVLFIPVITKIIWRDRIGRVNMAGIALAVAGIALLATGGGSGFNRGDIFSTFCAFLIACHIISVSKVLKNDNVFLITLVQFATVSLIAGAATLLLPLPVFTVTRSAVLSVAYCAVFPTVFCFTLQNIYQRYVTPTRAGLIYTLDPVWSLIAGFFVLGERLNSREWFGCGMIFLAALLPLLFRLTVESRLIRSTSSSYRKGIAMKTFLIMICTIIPLLAGCTSSQPPAAEKQQGREGTKTLEGASAVGYDGAAVRKSVDNTLNKNDDHNRSLDNAIKTGNDTQ